MGQEKVYILLAKLSCLYIHYAWISIMKKLNQKAKAEKMLVLIKTLDHYHHKFQLFQQSCKIVKEFKTEF